MRYGRVLSNHPINEEFEEQLSKPFYFRQEDHGAVLDVLFPKADETPEVAAFKKGSILIIVSLLFSFFFSIFLWTDDFYPFHA